MIVTLWKRTERQTTPPASLELLKGDYKINFLLAIPKLIGKNAKDIESYLDKHLVKPYSILGKIFDVKDFTVDPIIDEREIAFYKLVRRPILPENYYHVSVVAEVVTNPLPVILAIGAVAGIIGLFGFLVTLSIERLVRFGKPMVIIPIAVILVFLIIVVGPSIVAGKVPKPVS